MTRRTATLCEGCGKPMVWRDNDKTNKAAPVNVDPDPLGNVILVGDSGYHVLTKAERDTISQGSLLSDAPPPDRYTLHFATCTNPEAFRHRDLKAHKKPSKRSRR